MLTVKEWKEREAALDTKRGEEKAQAQRAEEGEKAVKAIFTKAEELGYAEKSAERHLLLSLAAADEDHGGTNGDLDKAHAAVEGLFQKRIQDYIDGKTTQRDAFPLTAEGGTPGNPGKTPKTWEDMVNQGTEMARAASKVGQ